MRNNLKNAIEQHKLTQSEIADALKINRATFSMIINGKAYGSQEQWKAIAAFFEKNEVHLRINDFELLPDFERKNLKNAIKEKGFSQCQFADKIGIATVTLGKILNSDCSIKYELVINILVTLGFKMDTKISEISYLFQIEEI